MFIVFSFKLNGINSIFENFVVHYLSQMDLEWVKLFYHYIKITFLNPDIVELSTYFIAALIVL